MIDEHWGLHPGQVKRPVSWPAMYPQMRALHPELHLNPGSMEEHPGRPATNQKSEKEVGAPRVHQNQMKEEKDHEHVFLYLLEERVAAAVAAAFVAAVAAAVAAAFVAAVAAAAAAAAAFDPPREYEWWRLPGAGAFALSPLH